MIFFSCIMNASELNVSLALGFGISKCVLAKQTKKFVISVRRPNTFEIVENFTFCKEKILSSEVMNISTILHNIKTASQITQPF